MIDNFSDVGNGVTFNFTKDGITWVGGETDAFVTGGMYFDVIKSSKSTDVAGIQINSAKIDIFKTYS